MLRLFFPIVLFVIFVSGVSKQEDPRILIDKTLAETKKLKSIEFNLVRYERFGDQFSQGKLYAKIQRSPRKVYLKNDYPDPGAEVLLVEGWNNGLAFVHPNQFPWFNLNFSPFSTTLMKNQHHSMNELGFDFFGLIISDALKKHGYNFEKYVSHKGFKTFDKRICHIIEINFTDYQWIDYTVQGNENLFSLEKSKVVPAYMVMEKNGLKDFYDVSPGLRIKIPNAYAKKSTILIDKINFMPLVMEVADEKGVFERYEYYDLKLNPPIAVDEFTTQYSAYGF